MFTHKVKLFSAFLVGVFLFSMTAGPSLANEVDVYVLFSSKHKKKKNKIVKKLEADRDDDGNKDMNVKGFNVDPLALADYSGKQKAMARFNKSKVAILIGNAPSKLLKGRTFKTNVGNLFTTKRIIKVKDANFNNVVSKNTEVDDDKYSVKTVDSRSDVQSEQTELSKVDFLKVASDYTILMCGNAIVRKQI